MNFQTKIDRELNASLETILELSRNLEIKGSIDRAASLLLDCFKSGGKVLIAGNGGSAADAQHIAAEFVSKLKFNRDALPAIALTTDTSIITAIGNDYGFEKLFARQVAAYGRPGDIFIGITTSGKSPNVLNGFKEAGLRGIKRIALCGTTGIAVQEPIEVEVRSPSSETARIQECHIIIAHILCDIVESQLFSNKTF